MLQKYYNIQLCIRQEWLGSLTLCSEMIPCSLTKHVMFLFNGSDDVQNY